MIRGILLVKCYIDVVCACEILNIIFALTNINRELGKWWLGGCKGIS
jgi:hypothetical protein